MSLDLLSQLDSEAPTVASECTKALRGTKVAVVGGGLAGLMAARELCEAGVKVTVYEARAQVGGRVLSDSTFASGRITEFGAELVGSIHPLWHRLARRYGISLISRMSSELYRGQDLDEQLILDRRLTRQEIKALRHAMTQHVLEPMAKLAKTQIKDPSQPWKQPNLKAFDGMTVAEALVKPPFNVRPNERLWLAIEHLLVNDNVVSLDKMNFLGLLCQIRGGQLGLTPNEPAPTIADDPLMGYWDELEIYRCGEGCQQLAFALEKEINATKGCGVITRRAVTSINLDGKLRCVLLTSRSTADTEPEPPIPLPYSYVILTAPPPVWHKIAIAPTHPKDVIGLMNWGPSVKFFTKVDGRFWVRRGQAPLGGSLAIGQVWEGTDNQTRIKGQATVLSAYAGGRTLTEKNFKDGLAVLYKDYPKKPTTRFANWPDEDFIKTGFAAPGRYQILGVDPQPGVASRPAVGRRLTETFQGRMMFAGEHTQMDHFGYMEGALRSGVRAANQVISAVCQPGPQRVPQRAPVTPPRSG